MVSKKLKVYVYKHKDGGNWQTTALNGITDEARGGGAGIGRPPPSSSL